MGDLGLMRADARASIRASVSGNLLHMAPEMLSTILVNGDVRAQYSVRADVWSFAMLIWETLACINPDSGSLEGFLHHNYAQKVQFDENHKADPKSTAELQSEMRKSVNDYLANHHPLLMHLCGMHKFQQSHQVSSVMEVALQLDHRLRGSMEHCLTVLELALCNFDRTALQAANAALQRQIEELLTLPTSRRAGIEPTQGHSLTSACDTTVTARHPYASRGSFPRLPAAAWPLQLCA